MPPKGLIVPTSQRGWLDIFNEFIANLRIDSKETQSADRKGTPLVLWGAQKLFLEEVCDGLDRGIRTFYALKSRQLGISTISLAIDIFWLAMHPGIPGVLVVDSDENREKFRLIIHRYIESFPKGFFGTSFGIVKGKDNRAFTHFTNGSTLDYLTAGKRKNSSLGESRAYAFAHLCMAKGTQVITKNGVIRRVEDVRIGDEVLTHTGAPATVIDVFGQPGKGKPMIAVRPWLGQEIRYTTWHKIPTQRGLVEAGDLRKDDLLVMPIRPIQQFIRSDILPVTGTRPGKSYVDASGRFTKVDAEGATVRVRDPWVTIGSEVSGKVIEFTEELGFAVGYYLAEGNLIHDRLGRPCGITFARHRNEKPYSDRAVKALSPYTTMHSRTYDAKGSLTTQVTVYGSALARWIDYKFGCRQPKRIPDEVFNWGDQFCRGLLCGLLSGDGSKSNGSNKSNSVVLPSTRSSIATQARDIAASLGYGWASIRYSPAGMYYGRQCKELWNVTWNGRAAEDIKAMVGTASLPRVGHDFTNKYVIKDGSVFIKIKSITACEEEEEVWDISVDHPDHTFRTPWMATSNTEVANYGDPDGLASFQKTLAQKNPDRLFIYESTAKGHNHWHDMYFEAKRDQITKKSFFIGWWAKEINSYSLKGPPPEPELYREYGAAPPDKDEREMIDLVKSRHNVTITKGQLAWIRHETSDTSVSESAQDQNVPWVEEQAFVLSGRSFFHTRLIQKDMARVQGLDEAAEPVYFKGYKFYIGEDFFSSKMEQVGRVEDAELRIWEEPSKHGDYVIGCDPAHGRNDNKDNHCLEVYRCYADKLVQVGEYATADVETRHAAWVLAYLGGTYRNCILNIELTGGPGMAVMTEFKHLKDLMRAEMYAVRVKDMEWEDFLNNARWYLYHRPDSLGAGYANGFMTTRDRKFEIFNQMRDLHATNTLVVNSLPLCAEMGIIVQDGSELGASGTGKDDRVFATALASRAYIEWVRPKMLAANMTYARVQAGEADTQQGDPTFVDRLVSDYFRRAEERAENGPEVPKWMKERGLA